jgi:hypothetical protein
MTRRSRWAMDHQARQRAKGLCSLCPEPLATANHCARHALAALARASAKRRAFGASLRPIRCKACQEVGHSRRTCELRKLAAALPERGRLKPGPKPKISKAEARGRVLRRGNGAVDRREGKRAGAQPGDSSASRATPAFLAWRLEKLRARSSVLEVR